MTIDLLLTMGIVLAAAVFVIRSFRKQKSGTCGCAGCESSASCPGCGQIANRP